MAGSDAERGFRPEVQGLRALAVLLVLGYHLFPGRVRGGYVGVDVFFVISGYLISAHLLREVGTRGTVSLPAFWARRARRLLPAAVLVLGVCLVLSLTVMPTTQRLPALRQVTASALYWQNWALASDAVDYLARGNAPTLVQHYWSLSVEEQFYLVWPVLVLAVARVLRGRGLPVVRRGLLGVVATLAAASLACSVVLTARSPEQAYFVTWTRGWELAAGALLALAGRQVTARAGVVLGWAGVGAIVAAGALLDDATAFPGAVALVPVLGAVAVLASGPRLGSAAGPGSASWWLSLRPARFVGDISYSVYLWHWPLVVVTPYVTGHALSTAEKPLLLVLTVLGGWASTRLVEDPVRRSRAVAHVPWRSLVAAGLAMTLVVGSAQAVRAELDRRSREVQQLAAPALVGMRTTGCLGPPALDPAQHCESPEGSGPLLVPAAQVAQENRTRAFPGCEALALGGREARCDLGDATRPRRTLAIVGDSHAAMWFRALDRIGRVRHWHVVTYERSSCPFTAAWRVVASEATTAERSTCARSDREVLRSLLADHRIDTVFVAAFSSDYTWQAPRGVSMPDPATTGFRRMWTPLVRAGKQVVVLRDVPLVKDRRNTPDCLVEHHGQTSACANPRAQALVPDIQVGSAGPGAPAGVSVVDLTDRFCDATWCHAVVGNVVVYRDYSHLSREYSTLLAPYLLRAFEKVDRH